MKKTEIVYQDIMSPSRDLDRTLSNWEHPLGISDLGSWNKDMDPMG